MWFLSLVLDAGVVFVIKEHHYWRTRGLGTSDDSRAKRKICLTLHIRVTLQAENVAIGQDLPVLSFLF